MISHDSGKPRPNDWVPRRNVRERRDFPRSGEAPGNSARRLAVATRRLTQVLGRVTGLHDVAAVAVRYGARCVRSRFGAFAVPTDEHELAILATHGYPLDLVRMIRIPSGTGVIGTVHASGTPMLVEDVAAVPGLRRRPRYRTNSFMAVPIAAGGDVLGVMCMADRLDDQPFTRDDLAMLRDLSAPVGLALARERARRAAEDYARAAITDPVSGLFNRRYFHERLEEELDRARRHHTSVALLIIDVDNFKGINDRFGHLAGDMVIRSIGDILKRSVRKFDLCTRFGGEEFAIVMPGSGPDSSVPVAERIRQRIEAFRASDTDLADLHVTASIGIAVSQGTSSRELIARADQALYEAKRAGKNRLVEWQPPPEPPDTRKPRNPR